MSTIQKAGPEELNQRYLLAAIAGVRQSLERHIAHPRDGHRAGGDFASDRRAVAEIRGEMELAPPLETISKVFRLSPFERDVLVLCAGVELDSSLAATLQKTGKILPTFSLALAALPGAHWSALSPAAPLRYWRLLEVNSTEGLAGGALKIDECMLHYLAGLEYHDERLNAYIRPAPPSATLVPSHQDVVKRVAALCQHELEAGKAPLLQLYGNDSPSQYAVGSGVGAALGLKFSAMSAQVIPHEPREREALARLWARQAAVTGGALLLDCSGAGSEDRATEDALGRFIGELTSFLVLSSRERRSLSERPSLSFEVFKPTAEEQLACWRLLNNKGNVNGRLASLVSQFNLSASAIGSICDEARKLAESGETEGDFGAVLWETCRAQTRRRLDGLAQRIASGATWHDLVLPEGPQQTLREIAAQVRQRLKVYETWEFASRVSRGLGITALFAGPSGTGKTMAAEVLANELHLDLYRIDLSQVVSKYIGETEKNLRRVFDAAEEGGAILLFDEADALFGKRSEVKDSHDRYANIEVSYLLQRMEDYRGLAVLTTNMKEALDPAFQRRLRFIVQFPFPNTEQRREIWRRIFPSATPVAGLDLNKLARLNVSGGNIRNIALYAAFLAADADEPVGMDHLLRAARAEYGKLEISLSDSEIRGWL